jgi:hypothetical protein
MLIASTVLYIFPVRSLIKRSVTVVIIINTVNELNRARGRGLDQRDSILWCRS